MGALLGAVAGAATTAGLTAGWYLFRRWVEGPRDTLQSDVEEAKQMAQQAQADAHDVAQDVAKLEQLLVGSDTDADDGVLVRLEQQIQDVKREARRSNRLQTEETHNLQELIRAIAEREDDLDVEIEDGALHIRGDEIPDGGIAFSRPPKEP